MTTCATCNLVTPDECPVRCDGCDHDVCVAELSDTCPDHIYCRACDTPLPATTCFECARVWVEKNPRGAA